MKYYKHRKRARDRALFFPFLTKTNSSRTKPNSFMTLLRATMANSRKGRRWAAWVFVLKCPNHFAIQKPRKTHKNLQNSDPSPSPFIKPYLNLRHHKRIRLKAIKITKLYLVNFSIGLGII